MFKSSKLVVRGWLEGGTLSDCKYFLNNLKINLF